MSADNEFLLLEIADDQDVGIGDIRGISNSNECGTKFHEPYMGTSDLPTLVDWQPCFSDCYQSINANSGDDNIIVIIGKPLDISQEDTAPGRINFRHQWKSLVPKPPPSWESGIKIAFRSMNNEEQVALLSDLN